LKSRTIWKYSLDIADGPQTIKMPAISDVLTAQMQGNTVTLWALVFPESGSDIITKTFYVFGTGWDVPDIPLRYINTVQVGWMVFHVFEKV